MEGEGGPAGSWGWGDSDITRSRFLSSSGSLWERETVGVPWRIFESAAARRAAVAAAAGKEGASRAQDHRSRQC